MLVNVAASSAPFFVYTQPAPVGMRKRIGLQDWELEGLEHQYPLMASFNYPSLEVLDDDTATVNVEVYIFRLAPSRHAAQAVG